VMHATGVVTKMSLAPVDVAPRKAGARAVTADAPKATAVPPTQVESKTAAAPKQGLWNQALLVALGYNPHPLTCTLD